MIFDITATDMNEFKGIPPYKTAFINDKGKWSIEISSLEDFVSIQKQIGHRLILDDCSYDSEHPQLEIYNDYH